MQQLDKRTTRVRVTRQKRPLDPMVDAWSILHERCFLVHLLAQIQQFLVHSPNLKEVEGERAPFATSAISEQLLATIDVILIVPVHPVPMVKNFTSTDPDCAWRPNWFVERFARFMRQRFGDLRIGATMGHLPQRLPCLLTHHRGPDALNG